MILQLQQGQHPWLKARVSWLWTIYTALNNSIAKVATGKHDCLNIHSFINLITMHERVAERVSYQYWILHNELYHLTIKWSYNSIIISIHWCLHYLKHENLVVLSDEKSSYMQIKVSTYYSVCDAIILSKEGEY